MTQTKTSASRKVLLVDDDDAVREMMSAILQAKGFAVTLAASVTEALRLIVTETFDVLITDLHMPNPSDGFAVITAMRHTQPKALTLLVSGYPDVKSAMDAILLEADDIIVKPFEAGKLAELVHDKLLNRKPAVLTPKERVASNIAAMHERCGRRLVGQGEKEQRTQPCFSQRPRTHGIPSEADRRPDCASESAQRPRRRA